MMHRRRTGEAHHAAILPDATIRIIRAIRERHGWPYIRIAEIYDQPLNSIVNYCAYITRRGAGKPTASDGTEADRICLAYCQAVHAAHSALAASLRQVTGNKLGG